MKKPAIVTWRHSISRRGNAWPPKKCADSASKTPAVMKRIAENSATGRLWTAIFENKKLDPQTR